MTEELKIDSYTLDQQFKSSSPANSTWVSANAGSGKTYVLTQRVIRLLLAGVEPDRILCVTFTKAAAANMKNRVFETLSGWTMLPDENLDSAIETATGNKPTPKARLNARKLFAKALDAPGGLKIQTIHGFCEALLHQFPLEANVPGHFETIQELEQADLLQQAVSDILSGRHGQNQYVASHHEALIAHASDAAIAEGIRDIIANREAFLDWTKVGIDEAISELRLHFQIKETDTAQTIKQSIIDRLPIANALLDAISEAAARSTSVTDIALAENLRTFLRSDDIDLRFNAIRGVCLRKDGELRSGSRIATKSVKEAVPELVDALVRCGEFLVSEAGRIHAPQLVRNSLHLFELGMAILERYQAMKQARALVDFNDLIERAANLLSRSDIRDWIRYRLDLGVDHVLVDEAQDTSPVQWQIINAITEDFHTGETASRSARTVFVVGDEKQSIFSFQGAEPEEFDRQQIRLKRRVDAVGKPFHGGRLNLSFRSTSDVLKAVDRVFENPDNRKGLSGEDIATVHDAVRRNDPGEVQVWPLFIKSETIQSESWTDPIDRSGDDDPAIKLAQRISSEIGTLVGSVLPGMKKPLQYKDVLILVRSRQPAFINALTRTMKEEGIAVAGSDRLRLAEHIAVEDLIAIGRSAILPQDDLSLAATLKSLLFDLSEEVLFEFAYGRNKQTSLREQISIVAADQAHSLQPLASGLTKKLEEISSLARSLSVFEFYARLLGEHNGRQKILARLGNEAEDVIDAFLDEALVHTNERDGGLESFLSGLVRSNPEIKREVELNRDEVRILTVHASKGLEAPVVFLVDSCGPAWEEKHRPPLLPLPTENPATMRVWLPASKLHTPETRTATTTLQVAAEGEYRRLLYVGMTRAADRLIVCGYQRRKNVSHPHWHQMVREALEPTATTIFDDAGDVMAWRWVERERQTAVARSADDAKIPQLENQVPDWLFEKAPTDPPLPRPLSPSGATALIEEDIDPHDADVGPPTVAESRFALQRGNITHRLLEILPDIEPDRRKVLATRHLDRTCREWNDNQKQAVLSDVFAILENPDFSGLFEGKSAAEVSVAGKINAGIGELQLSGQIDRLIVSDASVTILDYKTNRTIPQNAETVPFEYQVQLALYREMVRNIYPDHNIVAALLWTRKPELMILPSQLLDEALALFKKR